MKRTVTVRKCDEEESNDDLAGYTPAERIAMVWPLTRSAWAFKEAGARSRHEGGSAAEKENEPFDAQSRLPRHRVRFRRCGG